MTITKDQFYDSQEKSAVGRLNVEYCDLYAIISQNFNYFNLAFAHRYFKLLKVRNSIAKYN